MKKYQIFFVWKFAFFGRKIFSIFVFVINTIFDAEASDMLYIVTANVHLGTLSTGSALEVTGYIQKAFNVN